MSERTDVGEGEAHVQWLADLVRNRHSVRSFLPDPVPDHVIRDVFETARWAASNNNSQPWHVAVVSGSARTRLEERLLAVVDAGQQPAPAFPPAAAGFGEEHATRARQSGARLGALMGIDPDDSEGRARLVRRNWAFYDAPHVAFYSLPQTMGVLNAVDLGLFVHSVVLQLTARGIGTCLQGSLGSHPGPVHEIAHIPDGHGIVCGMSFGHPDPDARINEHRTDRRPLAEVVSFHD